MTTKPRPDPTGGPAAHVVAAAGAELASLPDAAREHPDLRREEHVRADEMMQKTNEKSSQVIEKS